MTISMGAQVASRAFRAGGSPVLFLLGALPALAGPIWTPPAPLIAAAVGACREVVCEGPLDVRREIFADSGAGGPRSIQAAPVYQLGAATVGVDARADSAFGVQRARTSLSMTGVDTTTPVFQTIGESFFRDILTATPGGAYFLPGYSVTGSFSRTGPAEQLELGAWLDVSVRFGPEASDRTSQGCNLQLSTACTLAPFPILDGEPFAFASDLFLTVTARPGKGGPAPSVLAGGADFSQTVQLDSILIFDAAGRPLADFQIQSASGTTYTTFGVTPEPGSLLLTLTAGMILPVVRSVQRRHHRR